MTFNQGDIILVPFPFTDQSNSKKRPALVISNSSINRMQNLICVPITSVLRNDSFTFSLTTDVLTTPLDKDSEARCDVIMTFAKTIVSRKISSVKPRPLSRLLSKIHSEILS